jgi:hypothetical protein
MMDRSSDGAHASQARYLRPDASRYIRPDALRFVRPDVVRVLAPGETAAEIKYRADQRRIPAGQFGGGRWTDTLLTLIFGEPPSTDKEDEDGEDDDGTEDDDSDDDGERVSNAEETFRNAYADTPPIADVDDGSTSSDGDGLHQDAGLEIETDVGPSPSDDTTAPSDQTDPLPIVPVAQRSRSFTDKYDDPYYSPGGHHEMPQGVFKKWDLQPETRRVFDDATTGPLPRDTFRTSPDGVPQGHFWNGPDGAHGRYNQAVNELSEKFLNDRNIRPSEMTPDDAWQLLAEIRESKDPRIRDYNDSVRLLRRLRLLRTGRGSQ